MTRFVSFSLFAAAVLSAAASPLPAQQTPGEPETLIIHYHRYDGDYDRVGLWTWDEGGGRSPEQAEVFPSGEDDFGKVFTLNPSDYGPMNEAAAIGFIPRLRGSWEYKDGSDRFWRPEMGDTIWLVGNDPAIYTEEPNISPAIQFAKIDDPQTVRVRFTHPAPAGSITADMVDVALEGEDLTVTAVRPIMIENGDTNKFEFDIAERFSVGDEVMVAVAGFGDAAEAQLGDLLFSRELFYRDVEMGAIYSPEQTTFRVFAPTATGVNVILYDNPHGPEGRTVLPMSDTGSGIWETVATGDLYGKHYMLYVDADGPGTRREVVDIYAKATTGRDGRAKIVDPRRYDPPGFRDTPRPDNMVNPVDAVVWEVSVRDFTMDESSGVPAELRGKYLGAAMTGTTVPGTDIKTGIDYLKELGVTHVQILPIQDFDNREDSDEYNWGYMTSFFDSPDGWFASDIEDTSRIREFKEMVQAFHDADIRVIMDVVYNHTAPNATFESLVPGYYHRRRPDGSYWNGSGTGNEFRSEAPMARKFIVDSVKYWVDEYKIDGFRFDLMGLVDAETMVEVRDTVQAIDPTIMVYGEPWTGGASGLNRIVYKDVAAEIGVGAFNDHFRNALKGMPDGDEPGFVTDGNDAGGVKSGIMASLNDWAQDPNLVIQYGTCHDNLTLWDKMLAADPTGTREDHLRMNELTIGTLAISQGVMFLHAASEFGYSKDGNHNSYNAPDSVNSIKWDLIAENERLLEFSKQMIALRHAHPVFRLTTAEEIEKRVSFPEGMSNSSSTIAVHLDAEGLEGEEWKEALVLINADAGVGVTYFTLPQGEWTVEAGNAEMAEGIGQSSAARIGLPSRTMVVLAR